jgi:polysaccharide biosynthesis/export protein
MIFTIARNIRATAATLAASALLLLGGCQSAFIGADDVAQANRGDPTQLPIGALPAAPVIGSTDYRVGPLDVIEIEVFGVEGLTRSSRISAAGQFSMPLIGTVEAGGKTVHELEALLAAKLSENYLQDPQVMVFVKEYNSQRVTVEGAVQRQGIKTLTGRTSLLQLVAMSEGLSQEANPKAVVIYRHIEGKRHAAAFDIREIRAGRMVDPEVIADDVVVVDYSGPRSTLRDFYFALPALFLLL